MPVFLRRVELVPPQKLSLAGSNCCAVVFQHQGLGRIRQPANGVRVILLILGIRILLNGFGSVVTPHLLEATSQQCRKIPTSRTTVLAFTFASLRSR